jgi:hypothetical protein
MKIHALLAFALLGIVLIVSMMGCALSIENTTCPDETLWKSTYEHISFSINDLAEVGCFNPSLYTINELWEFKRKILYQLFANKL